MARDRANIRTDLWGDDDWRHLSPGAQWLYLFLLSSSTLSYVGVADWRPARIAAVSATLVRAEVETWGAELEAARFIYRDDETEEVAIRSFLRHDGVLQNPNLWKSIGKDFAAIGSRQLRGFVAHEVRRLRDENPSGWESKKGGSTVSPWGSQHLQTMLDTPSNAPSTPDRTPPPVPGATGGVTGGPTVAPPTSTATSTATKRESPASRGTRLSPDWTLSESLTSWAAENAPHVDLKLETEKFRNYWIAKPGKDGTKLNWDATWKNWILRVRDDYAKNAPSSSQRLRIRAGQVVA